MFNYPFVDTTQQISLPTDNEVSFTSNAPIDGSEFPLGPQEAPEQTAIDISKYFFYVGEARQTNYDVPVANNSGSICNQEVSNDIYVDIDIMVSCPNKTVKLTKRIKLCKQSLAREAECKDAILNSMATVVEGQKEAGVKSQTQRMLELAGINHPKNYVL